MADDNPNEQRVPAVRATAGDLELVVRSTVPPELPYLEYRGYLRVDFFYQCAYCTTTEFEAGGVRFTIDHFEPRNARPELVNVYDNLLWVCDACNTRKGDRVVPPSAQADGIRFFRPDREIRRDHFHHDGYRVEGKTPCGDFSVQMLDLNREALRRIREMRQRLLECDAEVAGNLMRLRQFPIDQLPQGIRGRAVRALGEAQSVAAQIPTEIDELLRARAKSHLLDHDPSEDVEAQKRAMAAAKLKELYPGSWRAPRQAANPTSPKRGKKRR